VLQGMRKLDLPSREIDSMQRVTHCPLSPLFGKEGQTNRSRFIIKKGGYTHNPPQQRFFAFAQVACFIHSFKESVCSSSFLYFLFNAGMPRPLDTRAFGGGGAIHTVEVSVIALTIFNAFSAGLVCILIVIDNLRYKKSWKKLAHERRTPFYLAIAIFVSSIVFGIREFVLMGSGIPFTSEVPVAPSQTCIALNETCWWGTSPFGAI